MEFIGLIVVIGGIGTLIAIHLGRIASALEWLAEQGAEECECAECRNPGEAASVADLVDDSEESHDS